MLSAVLRRSTGVAVAAQLATDVWLRRLSTTPSRFRLYFSTMYESLMTEDVQSADSAMSCKSQKLMLYNGLIQPAHTGAYHLLPMGLRALNKLKRVVNESMRSIGAQELNLSTLSSRELWKKSGRWDSAGSELFKLQDRHNIEYCLGPTFEEVVTSLVASNRLISHKRLPILLYQITRKFRDEMAPKYGLLRGREFDMKDLYTFDSDEDGARRTYDKVCEAYEKLFERLELKFVKVVGDTGTIGGSLSHEYHIPAEIGQDNLLTCNGCGFSTNQELLSEETNECPDCQGELTQRKGIEIAHSFLLGTKYSKVFKAEYVNDTRKRNLMEMGCYGIGVTRLLAAGLEVLSTNDKLRWPRLLAPYQVCIIPQKDGYKSDVTSALAGNLYDALSLLPNLRDEVLIDDRTKFSIGKRFHQADRLGYPYIVMLGKRALEETPMYELVNLDRDSKVYMDQSDLLSFFSGVETVIG